MVDLSRLRGRALEGTFTLHDKDLSGGIDASGDNCEGSGPYSDLGPGTPVTLKDETGKILGSAFLGTGSGLAIQCTWTFTFEKVPTSAKFYSFEVGGRGAITYSNADMVTSGWTVGGTIGE